MLYFDCAASAPALPFDASYMMMDYRNPNSVHFGGRDARKALEWARDAIARCIEANPEQIAFTPSATAACRYAIDRLGVRVCSPFEHKAVAEHTPCGRKLIEPGMKLGVPYAHMLVNNETGEYYSARVRELAKDYSIFTDATAAIGHVKVSVQELGVDALAAGGHKFGAFPGIGFVYIHDGVSDSETFPGTPPVGLAVGMAHALEYRMNYLPEKIVYMSNLYDSFVKGLLMIPGVHINCLGKPHVPNIVSARFDGLNARELLTMLDVNGLCASAGSACTADSDKPSPVLLASGLTEEQALSTVRFSFCEETRMGEAVSAVEIVRRSVETLRSIG